MCSLLELGDLGASGASHPLWVTLQSPASQPPSSWNPQQSKQHSNVVTVVLFQHRVPHSIDVAIAQMHITEPNMNTDPSLRQRRPKSMKEWDS